MRKKHGMYGTPTHLSWMSMRRRVNNAPHYAGFQVCKEWDDFSVFLADMGERPDGTSLDRIDGSLGYIRGNCRWATKTQQNLNKSKRGGGPLPIGVGLSREWRYEARIGVSGCRYQLGTFETAEEASLAYQVAKDRWERIGIIKYF